MNPRVALARRRAYKPHMSLSGASAAAGAAPGANGGTQAPQTPSRSAPGEKSDGGRKFHPIKALNEIETGKTLTGKDLTRAARALTALEVRPQLHGYRQLAKQLHSERETEAQGLGRLGSTLQGNVTDVYKNIAASEADTLARQSAFAGQLNQTSGQIAQEGQQALTSMQGAQTGDVAAALQMRGAPGGGGAQQELANAVAAQQRSQVANSETARQSAASQGASYGQLSAVLGGAAQMQGGSAVGGIGREVLGRIGSSNQKYDESIQTALGKLADVKATKGALLTKNLLGLREGEQKFLLGKAAVSSEKEKLAAEKEQNEAANTIAQQKANASSTSAKASLIGAMASNWKAHHPEASSSEVAKHRKDVKHDVGEIKAILPTAVAEAGRPPKNKKELNRFIGLVNSKSSADPVVVRHVIKRWYEEHNKPKPLHGGIW